MDEEIAVQAASSGCKDPAKSTVGVFFDHPRMSFWPKYMIIQNPISAFALFSYLYHLAFCWCLSVSVVVEDVVLGEVAGTLQKVATHPLT